MKYDEANAAPSPDEAEVKLIDLFLVLAKRRKTLIATTLVGAAVGAAIAFLVPPSYRATTTMLPPQQAQSSASALLSQLGGAAGVLASAGGIKNPSDMYVAIFKSRTIGDKMVARFDLKAKYGEDSLEDARRELSERTGISAAKDGMITVSVEDHDRQLAAQLANAYVEELLGLTHVIALTEAGQRRLFFERQLEQAKNKLAATEVSIKKTMDSGGMVSVDVESRAMIETVGRLRAMMSAKQIQLDSMKSFLTTENAEYKKVESELASLRAELNKLSSGRPGAVAGEGDNSGLANIQQLRDLKYYQMLYELLAKQFEMARLDEARDAAVVQVLDPAIAPEKKFKPRRAVIILLAAFFGFCMALVYVFFNEKMKASASGGDAHKWQQLRAHLRGQTVPD